MDCIQFNSNAMRHSKWAILENIILGNMFKWRIQENLDHKKIVIEIKFNQTKNKVNEDDMKNLIFILL